jgi:hypothetical protein
MGVAYKNFWSLNTDEAVVAGILRNKTKKDIEVLTPLNAQMKGVDLYLINIKNKKTVTIQVKGSRAYEPSKKERSKYGQGSAGWYFFSTKIISKATADYFAFLVYVIEEDGKIGRRVIEPHLILIPTKELQKYCLKSKTPHGKKRYSFLIWVNPATKEAFDFRDKIIDFSKFLDIKGIKSIKGL